MKIALLTDGIWPFVIGGMQKHSFLLCKYLARKKMHIVLFHPELAHSDNTAEEYTRNFSDEENKFIEWVFVQVPEKYPFPGHYLYESFVYSKNCFTLLQKRKDICFVYTKGLAGWYALLKKDELAVKIGINIHGYEFVQIQATIKERMNALMLSYPFKFMHKKADYVFSYGGNISQYIKLLNVSSERIVEIPGGVEADWLLENISGKERRNARKLFFIGRYERRKGIEELNQILLKQEIPEGVEWHFAGAIPAGKRIKHDRIHYHGLLKTKDEIIGLMNEMDVLVCPSYSEGMPNVIMEAMSRGCAVIATNVGAVPLLVDSKNGWLIEPASVEQLSRAITEAAVVEKEKLVEMGKVSLQRIKESFTWDTISGQTAYFFQQFC